MQVGGVEACGASRVRLDRTRDAPALGLVVPLDFECRPRFVATAIDASLDGDGLKVREDLREPRDESHGLVVVERNVSGMERGL